jgi:hypothetical protein
MRYSAKKQTYTAPETEVMLDKMKRLKAGEHNIAKGAKDQASKKTRGSRSKKLRLGSEKYELRRKEKNLQKGSRNLFCEE